jgi:hypothetical protein
MYIGHQRPVLPGQHAQGLVELRQQVEDGRPDRQAQSNGITSTQRRDELQPVQLPQLLAGDGGGGRSIAGQLCQLGGRIAGGQILACPGGKSSSRLRHSKLAAPRPGPPA